MRSSYRLVAVVLTVVAAGCGLADQISPKPLTTARKIAGVWKTAVPVTLTYQTDFCSGTKQSVATSQWNVTWTITEQQGFENAVDIEMTLTRSGSTPLSSSCGGGANGWVPLVSPTFLEATMSSSAITAYDDASGISAFGSYTEDTMMLTWVHYECIVYCSGEVSKAQEFKLVRQR